MIYRFHTIDREVTQNVSRYAISTLGHRYASAIHELQKAHVLAKSPFSPWAVFFLRIAGGVISKRYVQSNRKSLRSEEISFIKNQERSSIVEWRVIRLCGADRVVVENSDSGNQITLVESNAQHKLPEGSHFLARVVNIDGNNYISGIHPQIIARPRESIIQGEMHANPLTLSSYTRVMKEWESGMDIPKSVE